MFDTTAAQIPIIEQEFVDVESIQWTKIVSLKGNTTEKAANKSKSEAAVGALYPTPELMIAINALTKLNITGVDSLS